MTHGRRCAAGQSPGRFRVAGGFTHRNQLHRGGAPCNVRSRNLVQHAADQAFDKGMALVPAWQTGAEGLESPLERRNVDPLSLIEPVVFRCFLELKLRRAGVTQLEKVQPMIQWKTDV